MLIVAVVSLSKCQVQILTAIRRHRGKSRELLRERSGSLSTLLGRKSLEKERARNQQQGTGSLHYWRWVCVVWAWQRLTCRMKQLPQLPRLTGEQEGTTHRHLATPKVWIQIVGVWSDHQWPQIQQLASLYSVKELHKSDLFTSYFKSSRKQALLDWNQ